MLTNKLEKFSIKNKIPRKFPSLKEKFKKDAAKEPEKREVVEQKVGFINKKKKK